MSFQEDFSGSDTHVPEPSKKMKFRKSGIRYLIIAVVCLVLSLIMYALDIGGAIAGAVSLVMIITFLGGAYYLIGSFIQK